MAPIRREEDNDYSMVMMRPDGQFVRRPLYERYQ